MQYIEDVSGGSTAPSTIVILGGDVHNAYVSEVDLGRPGGSRVFQIVCSPFRNRLSAKERRIVKATGSRVAGVAFSALARLARVPKPRARWRYVRRPTFDNSIGELELDGHAARVTLRRSPEQSEDMERLVTLHSTDLASGSRNSPVQEGDREHART